jgi:hypothetical protein
MSIRDDASNVTMVETTKRQHEVWSNDAEVKKIRWGTFTQTMLGLGLITIVLWVTLPLFWGSAWLELRYALISLEICLAQLIRVVTATSIVYVTWECRVAS